MNKKTLLLTILIAFLFLALCTLIPGYLLARDAQYVPGELLVKFRDGTSARDTANLHAALNASKKREFPRLKVHHLKLPKHLSVEEGIRQYEQNPDVEFAEPNYIVHALATTPDDPLFDELWGLHNSNDFDIDAPEAWDITTGTGSVVIAVIDSGLAYNHPDFDDNVWTNDIELADGEDGEDDDGNGYIDDFYGFDFVDNDGYPLDLNRHGTHVSGTIAAQGNDAQGITGVMWDAKIMSVRFLGLSGSGSTSDAIAAINYACANNAKIINNSWGGGGFSTTLKNAIEGCASGALFIFSAGNSGSNNDVTPAYPASYDSPNIISVAATNSTDSLAGFSNYGKNSVDLAAPGVGIYSSIPEYSYGTPVTIFPPAGTVENFEDSTGALPQQGWSRGGTNSSWTVTAGTGVGNSNSLEDSPGGDYVNNTLSWAAYMTPVDSSAKGLRYTLTFDWKGDLEYNWDWLDMIYSGNGSNWDWIDYRTGTRSSFTTTKADYTAVAETFDSFYFGFRIDSDTYITGDGVYIDNVRMTTETISIGYYDYDYYNGTSMAAPHVSGVAGLLLAYDPTLTYGELKASILNNVDPVAGLSGKVLTNGRLNAYKALLSITRPAAPSGLSATAISTSRVDLSWTDNAANESGFAIERKTGAGGTYVEIDTVGTNATSYSDTSCSASTTYYYRVLAFNSNGNSSYSNEADDTTLTVPSNAPSGLSATTASSSRINLSWTDNATNETGFRIERKTGVGGTYSQVAILGVNTTTYADTSCSAFTTYYYKVLAYNAGGDSAYSNEANDTTFADPSVTPSGLSATAVSSSQINLTWTDNSADEDGFRIERKIGIGGTYSQIATVGKGITSYSNLGLSGSTTYYYRVRAYIASVNSDYSTVANDTTFTPPPPAPDAPSGLSAAAVSTSRIDLLWIDKASNEDGFRIERKTGAGGTYLQIASVGQNTTSYSDMNLAALTTYFYRVRAYNTGGDSAYSNEADATTLPDPPAAPSGLSAATVSSSQINLSWTDNAANETGFRIERKTGAGGTYSQIASAGQNTTSYSDMNLAALTTYFYRVRAYNTGGNSAYSNEADDTTLTDPSNAPSGLSATAVSSSQINLSWTDNSPDETEFRIERKTGAGGTYLQIASVGQNTTSYSDMNLAALTTYFYRVRAYNTGGDSAYSNEADATTLPDPPAVPSGLSAATVSSSQINLSWTDNAANETGFRIERKTGIGGTYSQIGTAGQNTTTYSDINLAAATTYYYRVLAYNAGGDSAYSNEADDTTLTDPSNAPSGLSATAVSSSQINLSWTDNATDENGFRIERKTGVGGTYSQIGTVGINTTTYSNMNLAASTTYYYRVYAYNSGGSSVYSNEANATTLSNPPAAPSGLSASTVSNSQIDISWTDNAANETGFRIERKTGIGGTYSQIGTVGTNSTTYSNMNLAASTTYFYRVRAYNTGGNSAYSNEANDTTLLNGPAAPSDLSATKVSSSQIDLAWTDNSTDEDEFRIERKTGAGGTYSQIGTAGANITTYSDLNLAASTTYFYRVRAYNTGGTSFYSNEANDTTDNPAAGGGDGGGGGGGGGGGCFISTIAN